MQLMGRAVNDSCEIKPAVDLNPISILYRDEHFVVVNKPAGLLVHRSAIDKHETQFLLQRLRDQLGGAHLYPVHRLDKPTSGIILFTFSSELAKMLQAEMQCGNVEKNYLVVCRGFCPMSLQIDHPLVPINDFKKKHWSEPPPKKPAQEAVTLISRLATLELPIAVDRYPSSRYSLVKATLVTGRKHQLRRHFKHISHPIIGCPKYGKSIHNRFYTEHFGVSRLLLHAHQMVFKHPITQDIIDIKAPIDQSMDRVLNHASWQYNQGVSSAIITV